jgi:hypothetical protein
MKKYGSMGVGPIVAGVIVTFIGNRIYYSDPDYNTTTDPVGITMTVIGIVGLIVGIIVTVRARRSGAEETRALLVAADLTHAEARDSGAADSSTALIEPKKV